mgnify:CR=1 FL=1
MMILAPSILAADFKELGKEIQTIEENGAQYLHFDVMDGMFVPSISFGMPVLASIKGHTQQVMDVHLMVTEPIRYVEDFAKVLETFAEYGPHLVLLDITLPFIMDTTGAARSVRYRACR